MVWSQSPLQLVKEELSAGPYLFSCCFSSYTLLFLRDQSAWSHAPSSFIFCFHINKKCVCHCSQLDEHTHHCCHTYIHIYISVYIYIYVGVCVCVHLSYSQWNFSTHYQHDFFHISLIYSKVSWCSFPCLSVPILALRCPISNVYRVHIFSNLKHHLEFLHFSLYVEVVAYFWYLS